MSTQKSLKSKINQLKLDLVNHTQLIEKKSKVTQATTTTKITQQNVPILDLSRVDQLIPVNPNNFSLQKDINMLQTENDSEVVVSPAVE